MSHAGPSYIAESLCCGVPEIRCQRLEIATTLNCRRVHGELLDLRVSLLFILVYLPSYRLRDPRYRLEPKGSLVSFSNCTKAYKIPASQNLITMWSWRAFMVLAAWLAAVKAKQCGRQAAFKLSASSSVNPGERFGLAITIPRTSTCFKKPSLCMVLLDIPDGALVSAPLVRQAEISRIGDDFSQHLAWSLGNVSAGQAMYRGRKRMATVYTLSMSADLCAPRAALPFSLSVVVKPRTDKLFTIWNRRGKIPRPGKKCSRTVQVGKWAVLGGGSSDTTP